MNKFFEWIIRFCFWIEYWIEWFLSLFNVWMNNQNLPPRATINCTDIVNETLVSLKCQTLIKHTTLSQVVSIVEGILADMAANLSWQYKSTHSFGHMMPFLVSFYIISKTTSLQSITKKLMFTCFMAIWHMCHVCHVMLQYSFEVNAYTGINDHLKNIANKLPYHQQA